MKSLGIFVWIVSSTLSRGEVLGLETCEVDVLFVLDASSSVKGEFESMKSFIHDLASQVLHVSHTHRASVLQYAGKFRKGPNLPFGVFRSTDHFLEIIKKLRHLRGTTYTGRALGLAKEMLKDRRMDVLTLVLVVTDGKSFDEIEEPAKAIRELQNVLVYAASTSEKFKFKELESIAGDAGRVMTPPDVLGKTTAALGEWLDCVPPTQPPTAPPTTPSPATTPKPTRPPRTTQAAPRPIVYSTDPPSPICKICPVCPACTCSSPPPSPTPQDVPIPPSSPHPQRKLRPTTRLRRTRAPRPRPETKKPRTTRERRTRPPPTTPRPTPAPTTPPLSCQVDIILVLDFSGSLTATWQSIIDMSVDLVNSMRIGLDFTRIGAVKFSHRDHIRTLFRLDKYDTADQIVDRLDRIQYIGGVTHTGPAVMHGLELFGSKNGGRDDVAKVMVLFSDGYAQIRTQEVENLRAAVEQSNVNFYSVTPYMPPGIPPNIPLLKNMNPEPENTFTIDYFDDFLDTIKTYNGKCKPWRSLFKKY